MHWPVWCARRTHTVANLPEKDTIMTKKKYTRRETKELLFIHAQTHF